MLVTLLIDRLRWPGPDIRWDLGRLSHQARVTPRWALRGLNTHLSEAPIVIVRLVQEDSAFLLQSRRKLGRNESRCQLVLTSAGERLLISGQGCCSIERRFLGGKEQMVRLELRQPTTELIVHLARNSRLNAALEVLLP